MRKIKVAPDLASELLERGIAALAAESAPTPVAYPATWAQVRGGSRNAAQPTGSARGASASSKAAGATPTAYPESWGPRGAQARVGSGDSFPAASSAPAASDGRRPAIMAVHAAGQTGKLIEAQRRADQERQRASQRDQSYITSAAAPSPAARAQLDWKRAEWHRMDREHAARAQAPGGR